MAHDLLIRNANICDGTGAPVRHGALAVKGTPDEVVKQLRERVSWGITMFTMMFADMAPPQTVELFAREVMPAFA